MPDKYDPDDAFPTKKLLKRLAAVNRPSSYCTSGTCPLVLPGLEVEGLGVIGLPVSPVEAARIIKVCNQAPYGKGTQTIVDTSVRKVWELDAQKFTLGNPQWSVMIEGVLRAIEKALGLSAESLTAHIYKLLVYEPGGFFLMHRDGEKLDRMVATLVVNLPSQHDGGELVVLHQGHQSVLRMPGAASGFSIEYAAFYSDCQHEVKPVVSGNRVCLTYNLVLADSHKHTSIGAPDFQKVEDDLARLIGSWCESVVEHGDEPVKVAVMLDHRYSEDGLSIHNLKGTDQAKAEVLFNAAAKANCDAHLALITLYESGSVEGGYGYGSYSDDDYHEEDEEEEEDEALAVSSSAVVDEDGLKRSKHVMGEVFDSSLTADHWSDRNGAIVPFGRVSLLDEEIVTNRELADGRPSVEEYEGYTGNAGMTLERWYHRAAIVLWPRAIQFQIYLEAGTEVAVAGLAQLIGQQKSNNQAAGGANCEALRSFAKTIIETWQLHRSSNPESFFSSLELLDAVPLAMQFIEKVLPHDTNTAMPDSAIHWLAKSDPEALTQSLKQVIDESNDKAFARNVKLFLRLSVLGQENAVLTKVSAQLAPGMLARLQTHRRHTESGLQPTLDHLLVDLLTAFSRLTNHGLLEKCISWMIEKSGYSLREVQLPALQLLASQFSQSEIRQPVVQRWIEFLESKLEAETETETRPAPPSDWRRPCAIACDCADCTKLTAFLNDPKSREARFPLAESRRRHLHQIIQQNRCDCSHDTYRVGRPYVLVCRKTSASYERACASYDSDLKSLSFVKALRWPR